MPTDWGDMDDAERDPLWARFTDDGHVIEEPTDGDDQEPVELRQSADPLIGVVLEINTDAGEYEDSRTFRIQTTEFDRPVMFWGTAHINRQVDSAGIVTGHEIGIKPTGETVSTGHDNEMQEFVVKYSR